MKIVIADDELRLRKVIALYMSKCNYEVLEAGSGNAALDLVKEHNPDAVVLDVMMTGMTGIETAKAIREIPEFKNLPIVFLTANASEDDIKNGLAAGADKYITKPFSPKDLVETLENLIKSKG
ncbi:MAG: response regulator [Mucispirillum sp.]|nr:response regulator [Mucispirillum sp.]